MKTSDLIIELVNSLKKYGDLPITMVDDKKLSIGWYCPSEGGKPQKIVFDIVDNIEMTDCNKENKNV